MRQMFFPKILIVLASAAALSPGLATAQNADIPVGPNDTVRVRVYEWKPSEALLVEWPSLTGEFEISAAGRLFLPLVGELPADGKLPSELAAAIEGALQDKAGLVFPPTATVEIAQYSPVYATGQVNLPGAYEFQPGLTVLKAISLAGGVLRAQDDSTWSATRDAVQASGEVHRLETALKVLLARRARLEAEFSGAETIEFPADLTEATDTQLAEKVMAQEADILASRRRALAAQTLALENHKDLLKEEIQSLEEQSDIKAEQQASLDKEAANLRSLVERGLASQPRELSLQREVADARADQIEIRTLILRAQQDVAKADLNILELSDNQTTEVAADLQKTVAEIEDLSNKRDTARQVLIRSTEAAGPVVGLDGLGDILAPSFTIIRQDGSTIAADENTALLPGDVIKVEMADISQLGADLNN